MSKKYYMRLDKNALNHQKIGLKRCIESEIAKSNLKKSRKIRSTPIAKDIHQYNWI